MGVPDTAPVPDRRQPLGIVHELQQLIGHSEHRQKQRTANSEDPQHFDPCDMAETSPLSPPSVLLIFLVSLKSKLE